MDLVGAVSSRLADYPGGEGFEGDLLCYGGGPRASSRIMKTNPGIACLDRHLERMDSRYGFIARANWVRESGEINW